MADSESINTSPVATNSATNVNVAETQRSFAEAELISDAPRLAEALIAALGAIHSELDLALVGDAKIATSLLRGIKLGTIDHGSQELGRRLENIYVHLGRNPESRRKPSLVKQAGAIVDAAFAAGLTTESICFSGHRIPNELFVGLGSRGRQ